jgi:hypothetical protein
MASAPARRAQGDPCASSESSEDKAFMAED